MNYTCNSAFRLQDVVLINYLSIYLSLSIITDYIHIKMFIPSCTVSLLGSLDVEELSISLLPPSSPDSSSSSDVRLLMGILKILNICSKSESASCDDRLSGIITLRKPSAVDISRNINAFNDKNSFRQQKTKSQFVRTFCILEQV